MIYYLNIESPIGEMRACASDVGLLSLSFVVDEDTSLLELKKWEKALKMQSEEGENEILVETKKQVFAYFQGNLQDFSIPYHFLGTDFQQKVWRELSQIPFGQVRSYLQQAKALGDVKAIRAVASANGKNPIAILVPCHRVIGSDGSLTGYAGGLWRKKWLLNFEKDQDYCLF